MRDLAEEISLLIKEYLASENMAPDIRLLVETQNALPLWLDMRGCIAIRPDGTFVSHEWDTDVYKEETNPAWHLLALAHGSKRYPVLEAMLPAKTPDTLVCSVCNGTGKLVLGDRIFEHGGCGNCFGLGWVNSYVKSLRL